MSSPATVFRPVPRGVLAVFGVAGALWLAIALPLAFGQRTLYFRDVFTVHLPLKAFGAEQLAAGKIPALDPSRGLGQPFRGNPQAAAFYPGNLLYLALPFWSAFNLHYALHWLLALVTLIALARELRMSWAAAAISGLAYAGSGWTLSALTFHHVVVVTAWWPLAMWGVVRGGRKGLAWGGLACGLALLGGAWVVAGLGVVPLLLVAFARTRHRPAGRRLLSSLGSVAAVLALGAIVALPQLVATARALPFTLRGTAGVPLDQVALYSLHPLRWLELLLPLPWGWPADLGSFGYWSAVTPRVPLVLSLHCGLVALVLALVAARRRLAWAALAVAGLVLAWLGGVWPEALSTLSAGLFRYPEKALFWTALAFPLLAGWGADGVLGRAALAGAASSAADPSAAGSAASGRRPPRLARACLAAAGLALAAGAVALLVRTPLAGWLRTALAPARGPAPAAQVELQVALAAASLLLAALLLTGTAWAVRRARGRGGGSVLAALQLVALLPLAPLVMTADAEPFRRAPEWAERVPAGTAVVSLPQDGPFDEPPPPYRLSDSSVAARLALGAADLAPVPGVLAGWTYPLAPDADGLASPLTAAILYHLPQLGPEGRAAWLRAVGTEAVVAAGEPAPGFAGGLVRQATADRAGVPTALYRVETPAPAARWPARLETAAHPIDALLRVSRRPPGDVGNGGAAVVAEQDAVAHRAGGLVKVLSATPDRWIIEVASGGGVAVLRRAYQRLWTARTVPPETFFDAPAEPFGRGLGRARGQTLSTLPADLALLGVAVPPGLHRVEVFVSARPEAIAAAVAALAWIAALALGLLPSPRASGEGVV